MIYLTIKPCTVDKKSGKVSVKAGQVFKAMLNPTNLKRSFSIKYDKTEALGKSATENKFVSIGDEKLSFSLMLDGTGVVPSGAKAGTVADQLQALGDIIYSFDGTIHEPRVVQVQWGGFIYYGRLDSLSFDYTLFDPKGAPLRAKAELAFSGYVSKQQESRSANRNSPDLTHIVEFKAGDSLPLLCQEIYEDAAYYTAVARYNHIANFRAIEPGRKIMFPPIK